ncbi:MAG: hypothetical protein V4795_05220 [Pseudomonadota bacterium]
MTAASGRRALLAALAAAGLAPPVPAQPAAAPAAFDFIALGDMPYGPDLIAGPPYRSLIARINGLGLPFAIHVGDFKDGTAACSDAEFQLQWQHFQRFAGALVYTPGDNDWLDCQRRGDDPLERLQALRQRFFHMPASLGQRPLPLQRQAEHMPAHAGYPENQRWWHQGVLFATFHTVGPRNGFDADSAAVRAEAQVREAANSAWIADSFALARRSGASALVLATQAESLRHPQGRGTAAVVHPALPSIAHTLLPLAEAAPHPVLLVHGDLHAYTHDQPFTSSQGRPISKPWRLQVFGQPRLHAVRVRVQPAVVAEPFAFSPVWNPLSTDPRQGARGTP